MEDYITIRRASQLLGISVQAVYRLIERGRIGRRRIGATWMVKRSRVLELLGDQDYRARSDRARPHEPFLPGGSEDE